MLLFMATVIPKGSRIDRKDTCSHVPHCYVISGNGEEITGRGRMEWHEQCEVGQDSMRRAGHGGAACTGQREAG
jgi:hypothetical protein